jgi:2-oxoglutarate/2-oxoacid ferredoxin oxidoreductase subunit beta
MTSIEDFGAFKTAWCPGCGNFAILKTVKKALVALDLRPHQVLFVSGIGQAAKAPHYLNANLFNGLHGRALPVATGARLANPDLKIIVQSGDGCTYGEGGNHLLAAIRRNVDVTLLVHNNHVYALTKGQASPTSTRDDGFVKKAQPEGAFSGHFNPVEAAIALGAGFVARGFTGEVDHLSELMQKAVAYSGFALVDILQPCVSFNEVDIFQWYKERCYLISPEHDVTDRAAALELAGQWGERIPLGIFHRIERPSFEGRFHCLNNGPLALQEVETAKLEGIMKSYE